MTTPRAKASAKTPSKPAAQSRCFVAQFCDDIRYELGNKITIVGLYNGYLYLHEFPALIPRFAVNAYVDLPIEEQITTVGFRIEKGDETVFQTSIEPGAPEIAEVENGHDQFTRRSVGVQISLPPLTVMAPCMLRSIITIDGVEHVAGKLRIAATPTAK
ncbi:hypothetical protein [Polaromonas sp. YR568]|uniref:DUF6941 family protein n=1 Tax=Polaromonas sp. YR568 TaxID=1855301 RepID=UPI00111417DB|nr:hypothetical protein [Polaromonas sp. YR568]